MGDPLGSHSVEGNPHCDIQWRRQYDCLVDEEIGLRNATSFEGVESLTQVSFAEDADINILMKRFGVVDGSLLNQAVDPKFFGDVSNVPDLRTVLDIARVAEHNFRMLPADLRSRFHNRADLLHEFVSNPDNLEESFKLGLLKRPVVESRRGSDPLPRRRRSDAEEDARGLAELRRRRGEGPPPGEDDLKS